MNGDDDGSLDSGAVSGSGTFGKLKYENGVHIVQVWLVILFYIFSRLSFLSLSLFLFVSTCPMTEKSGRVHISAISTAILPRADEVDVQLFDEDLKINTYRSGGAGCQSVNTATSAVRITHTGYTR